MKRKNKRLIVENCIEKYSNDRVTPQVLNGMADWLHYTFPFLNIEDRVLYLYDEDYYHLFTSVFAERFLETNLKDLGLDFALRSGDYKEIVKLLKGKTPKSCQDECRTNIYRILFSDGVFDVRDQVMYKPCMEDYIFSKIDFPLNWDKEYKVDPEARDFIQRFCNHSERKEMYLWELIGLLLSGFQKKIAVAFWGPSDSGKSTLANMVRRICGSSSCVALGIKDLGKEFGLAELQGKKLCIDSDMDATFLNAKDISILKKVTGNDWLQGNRKHEQPFYFQCQAKLLLCMNNKIRFNSDEDLKAVTKRIRAFELSQSISIEEQRCDMDMMLDKNRTYFLHKAMEGLCRLYDNNFKFSCDEASEKCVENVHEATGGMGIREFLKTCCEFSHEDRETVADLFCEYERFMSENGWEPIRKKEFSCFLVDKCGLTRERTEKERFLKGIRLLRK